jgi:hypothetical protein
MKASLPRLALKVSSPAPPVTVSVPQEPWKVSLPVPKVKDSKLAAFSHSPGLLVLVMTMRPYPEL